MTTLKSYPTRSNAVRAAKIALTRAGVDKPLSGVHFIINEGVGTFSWEQMNLSTGLPLGVEPPAEEIRAVAVPGKANHFELNEAGKKAVAAARVEPQAEKTMDKVMIEGMGGFVGDRAAREVAKPLAHATPSVADKAERWRMPKSFAAQKTAYRPRPGSKQDTMYQLLTRSAGITLEGFCAEMNKPGNNSGKTDWVPKAVWSALGYLFVTQKGYGLTFDGKVLRLVVPADERVGGAK